MERVTHRTYLTWQAWMKKEFNRPGRTDHYLMQLSADIRNTMRSERSSKIWQPEDCRLTWTFTVGAHQRSNSEPEVTFIARRGDRILTPPAKLTKEKIDEFNERRWYNRVVRQQSIPKSLDSKRGGKGN